MRTSSCLFLLALLPARAVFSEEAPSELARAPRAVEVAISDEALQMRYLTAGDRIGAPMGRLVGGLLVAEKRDLVGAAALLVPLDFRIRDRLTVEFGPQLYMALLADDENSDVFAMSVGAQVRLGLLQRYGVDLVASGYYSPDVLTFGSADNLVDVEGRVETRLTEKLIGLAGVRRFELDLAPQGTRKLQDEFFVGVRWRME